MAPGHDMLGRSAIHVHYVWCANRYNIKTVCCYSGSFLIEVGFGFKMQARRLSWHRVVAPVSGDQAERGILARPRM